MPLRHKVNNMKLDFNQEIRIRPPSSHGYQLLANLIVVIATITILISLGALVNSLNRINQDPGETTASQLLNQTTIDQAIDLLENQTVNFSPE